MVRRLALDLLRPALIATDRVVPLAGVLGLFHFGVVPEVNDGIRRRTRRIE